MSRRNELLREAAEALLANPDRKLRGPNGHLLCVWCGTEVTPPKRCWCSQTCIDRYLDHTDWRRMRWAVYRRDDGKCQGCGFDIDRWRRLRNGRKTPRACKAAINRMIGLPTHHRESIWECDHIVPVAEGGHALGIDNLRVLCKPCHRKETARYARIRAHRRRLPDLPSDRARLRRLSRSRSA